ncbi:MAG: hypothetical protein F4X83_00640 [Chloroflexi bacterium]|nr:hypothetical protein [Chloroflexota bacterium]MYB75615.1 hypothetical protein [Chloroflexota bacterium]
MPNPFHFRANIDRLWRQANSNASGYRRLNALDAIVREMFAPNERARLNYQTYLATDPYDVARHKLRDLYDRADPAAPAPAPVPGSVPLEDECSEEDDDPW